MVWTGIAVSLRQWNAKSCVEKEIKLLKKHGLVESECPVLVVQDACTDSGSGGATLNTLLVFVEHLCASQGYTVLNERVLIDSRILIIHMGHSFVFDPRGAAFLDLNCDFVTENGYQTILTPLVHQIKSVTQIASDMPPGVWILGTDSYWKADIPVRQLMAHKGSHIRNGHITVFSVPVTVDFALDHGVYKLDDQNTVSDILYKEDKHVLDNLRDTNGKVPIVIALTHLSTNAAQSFLTLHSQYPLSSCTYLGIDSGCVGYKLSLFFDFLLPTCKDVLEQDYLLGIRSGLKGKTGDKCETRPEKWNDLFRARKLLWDCFSKMQTRAVVLDNAHYHYFTNIPNDMVVFAQYCLGSNVSNFHQVCKLLRSPTFQNVTENHTDIRFVVRFNESESSEIFAKNIPNDHNLDTNVVNDFQDDQGNAFCLDNVFSITKTAYYFSSAREYKFNIWLAEIVRVLKANGHKCLLPIFHAICSFEDVYYSERLLKLLHDVAVDCKSSRIRGRTMCCVADTLGCLAEAQGGLRSGPAANPEFVLPLSLLHSESTTEKGIFDLWKVCKRWMDTPYRLIRAARHYEAAAQIFTRRTVMQCSQFIKLKPSAKMSPKWCKVFASGRIDIAGGWSDTPPITVEYGGAVVNMAVKVDGQKPISVFCEKMLDTSGITVEWHSEIGQETTKFDTVEQILASASIPSAQGALMCAVFVTSGLIDAEDSCSKSLCSVLMDKLGDKVCGLKVETKSALPHGSGLGTSSIMAGCLLAAVWTLMALEFDYDCLLHGVLYVEQLLTTGGGWQDQVGGLCPGAKIGHFGCTPDTAKITVDSLYLSQSRIDDINKRLVLVYTGRTRLAKNLLQEVVRNWFGRQGKVVNVVADLIRNAEVCADAVKNDDWIAVSECARKYWEQKKVMAPGCEPAEVSLLIHHLYEQDIADAAWLAGAGGGGFMYVLLKKDGDIALLQKLCSDISGCESMTMHSVEIDMSPLLIESAE